MAVFAGTGALWGGPAPAAGQGAGSERLRIEVHFRASDGQKLGRDVREGLAKTPKSLPPKYFYDELGSKLFDRICDTPEYYPTRSERALLERIAPSVVERARPHELVELGSGAARKTRVLLDAMGRAGRACVYVPFDISESMLRNSASQLLRTYPWLRVHGIVGDYEQHLEQLPNGGARLFLFLGSTIGNFEPASCVRFLRRIAGQMKDSDFLLIGTDTLKDTQVLNAAYNDAQGVTAAFNKNLLSIINRELDAEFDTAKFQHVAFFDEEKSQIEMYLEARVSHQVRIRRLGMTVGFRARERILTEISRKFTRSALEYTLHRAGLELDGWFVPDDEKFALSLTTRAAS